MTQQRMKIVVPSGIGDFSWMYSKLVNLSCMLDVEVAQTGGPLRLKPYADILPKISSVSHRKMSWNQLKSIAISAETTLEQLDELRRAGPVFMETNSHLEAGRHLKDWLPCLNPIRHHYDVRIPQQDAVDAAKLVPKGPFIALFASSLGTSGAWKTWQQNEWVHLMMLIREHVGDIEFVLVGAKWDVDLGKLIEAEAKKKNLNFTNLVDTTTGRAGMVLHIISLSSYFIAFPSGLGILADVIEAPATMFYARVAAHEGIIHNWADPESVESLRYYESMFVPPAEYAQWLFHTYKLKDKLGATS